MLQDVPTFTNKHSPSYHILIPFESDLHPTEILILYIQTIVNFIKYTHNYLFHNLLQGYWLIKYQWLDNNMLTLLPMVLATGYSLTNAQQYTALETCA